MKNSVRNDQRPKTIHKAKAFKSLKKRNKHHCARNELCSKHEELECAFTLEGIARKSIPTHDGNYCRYQNRHYGHEHTVHEVLAEVSVLPYVFEIIKREWHWKKRSGARFSESKHKHPVKRNEGKNEIQNQRNANHPVNLFGA